MNKSTHNNKKSSQGCEMVSKKRIEMSAHANATNENVADGELHVIRVNQCDRV